MPSKSKAKFKQTLSKRLANVCISPLYESEKENESESDKDNGGREREAPVVDKSALAGYLRNDDGVKNVIDIFEHDKLEKMAYKTECVPGGWGLFFCFRGEWCDGEIGEKAEGENVEDVVQALCVGKGRVFEIFNGYRCYGVGADVDV